MILPGMDVTDPTDKSFFLGTQIEGDEGFHHRSTTWPEYRVKAKNALLSAHKQKLLHPRRAEYCDTESYYISGPSGFSK